jgi:hypothetical protein
MIGALCPTISVGWADGRSSSMDQQTIMNSDALVYRLTRSHPPDSIQIQRQHTRLFALLVVVALGLVLAPLFLPRVSFWKAWQQASWGDYWHDLFPTDIVWSFLGVFVLSYLLRGLEA